MTQTYYGFRRKNTGEGQPAGPHPVLMYVSDLTADLETPADGLVLCDSFEDVANAIEQITHDCDLDSDTVIKNYDIVEITLSVRPDSVTAEYLHQLEVDQTASDILKEARLTDDRFRNDGDCDIP